MAMQNYKARVSDHTVLKGHFQYLKFELTEPNTLDFKSGQFVMLNIPGAIAKRAYSIASNPVLNHEFDLLVDVGPQGDGSLYLQSLNPGEEVTFMAPGGQFVIAQDPTEQAISLIATGSGISACRSMALNLLQTKNDSRPIILHWGMRNPEDIFWEDDFRLLEQQFPNFHFDLVLSKAPPGWPLCAGHINDCIDKHYRSYSNIGYYMCGNKHMIEDISTLLAGKGVLPANIHHERFF
jgi:NAD(P)H-flavin reductase